MSKKTALWLIAATALILIGGLMFTGALTAAQFDFANLSDVTFETNRYEIDGDVRHITIDADNADITFAQSDTDTIAVVCYEPADRRYTVSNEDNTLTIHTHDTRKWYEHIHIVNESPTVTVFLPKDSYGTLSINTVTSDLTFTGGLAFDAVDIRVTTGGIDIRDLHCRTFRTQGTTGDVQLNNVLVDDTLFIKRTTGDVTLTRCDAADIAVTVTTGDITGTLLTDKVFAVQTTTGDMSVPDTHTGGNCTLTATTGDIAIEIEA